MPNMSTLIDLAEDGRKHHGIVTSVCVVLALVPGHQLQVLSLVVEEVAVLNCFQDGHAPPPQEWLQFIPRNFVNVNPSSNE